MTSTEIQALYPQSVKPSARPLPLLPFVFRFVKNPLRSLPKSVYEEPIVTYGKRRILAAWVTDPELTERILLKEADKFPKTRLDRRVLKPVLGNGLLNAEGASWRWQRKLASPLFPHAKLLRYVPTMVQATQEQLTRWQSCGTRITSDVAADMTETTFAVIARTVLEGIDESEADAVKQAGHEYLDPISWEVASALLQMPESLWHPGKSACAMLRKRNGLLCSACSMYVAKLE